MTHYLSRRRLLSGAAGLAAATALPRTAHADWRPTEAVRIIIPAAPGGTTDVMGRLLAQHLQVAWGQSDRRGKQIRRRRHDRDDRFRAPEAGRPHHHGRQSGAERDRLHIFRNISYKPDQLQPVSNLIRTTNIVSAHPSVPVKSIPRTDRLPESQSRRCQLCDLRHRTEPASHRRVVPAAHRLEDDACAVPRRGPGTDRRARRTGADPVRQSVSLAAADPRRQPRRACDHDAGAQPLSTDIPTMRESAPELAKFDVSSWFGVFLPRGVPQPVLDALNGEIKVLLDARRHEGAHQGHRRGRRLHDAGAVHGIRAERDREVRRDHRARKSCRWTSIAASRLRAVRARP